MSKAHKRRRWYYFNLVRKARRLLGRNDPFTKHLRAELAAARTLSIGL